MVKDPDSVEEHVDKLRTAIRGISARRVVIEGVSTLYLAKPSIARCVENERYTQCEEAQYLRSRVKGIVFYPDEILKISRY